MTNKETWEQAKSTQHDFDFLIGDWEADITRYEEGNNKGQKFEGSWHAKASFDGRVIEDKFVQKVDGVDSAAAFTIRTYCDETGQWEMLYLWSNQPASGMLSFIGKKVGNEMHLRIQQLTPSGRVSLSRIRFYEIETNSFRWSHHISSDDGETWSLLTELALQRH